MKLKRAQLVERATRLREAFPPDEPTVYLPTSAGPSAPFRVCNICGNLVLETLVNEHILSIAHDSY